MILPRPTVPRSDRYGPTTSLTWERGSYTQVLYVKCVARAVLLSRSGLVPIWVPRLVLNRLFTKKNFYAVSCARGVMGFAGYSTRPLRAVAG